MSVNTKKVTGLGLIVALGIIFGDIGTSPLYVFKAIVNSRIVTEQLIIGSLSCIIWTLTLQTTIKYVILTLKADNKGEGGIFSLYTLVKRRKKWLVIAAMIGGSALLADGMITPPVTVTAAIEGLRQIPAVGDISTNTIIYIVIGILTVLFLMQQIGTGPIGKFFGPVMFIWFLMLAVMGCLHLFDSFEIFKAFNPAYAVDLLTHYPKGFWILGAVFLCTTGAEALYSDLGHCGRGNIRISWIYVKACLILNYLGQGAWMLANYHNQLIDTHVLNPFYGIMPDWFRLTGIIIATLAAIIASQALISGSFTLVGEAIRLNLWPKLKIKYPSEEKGQLYIPGVNLLLYIGCVGIVLYFRKSDNMEAAYGLAITLCMIATSLLFANYLVLRRVKPIFIYLYLIAYFGLEGAFLGANLEKFPNGGYVALIVAGILFFIMYIWYRARKIKNRYVEFVRLEHYLPKIQELSTDKTIPKYATHLVFLTSANNPKEIEHKIIYSILSKKPKRADIYWIVHVDTLDEPYTCDYTVEHIIPNDIIRIDFKLGFRRQPRINLLFQQVVEELAAKREINISAKYETIERSRAHGDFQFVVMEKYLSQDSELPFTERFIMQSYFWLKEISLSEEKGFGLDQGNVTVEKFPLTIGELQKMPLRRLQ
ncbi:MAG TPA: KUP/HAK/KT family potassium transporter [Chitinophagaceae bacterium]|mgnify:FL=1|nr:KUP/HAK/KT family potassium transporter [Chitinophagaceae bacterium]